MPVLGIEQLGYLGGIPAALIQEASDTEAILRRYIPEVPTVNHDQNGIGVMLVERIAD